MHRPALDEARQAERRRAVAFACSIADRGEAHSGAIEAYDARSIEGERDAWMVGRFKVGIEGSEVYVEDPR